MPPVRSVRLYALPSRALPGARPDELLQAIGAPPGGGIFETVGSTPARDAVAEHKVGVVDPPADDCLAKLVFWCLALDPVGGGFIGPVLHFDSADFSAPSLLPGGLPASAVVRAYCEGAPVPLALPPRIHVRLHRPAPSPIWRRREVVRRDPMTMLQQRDRDLRTVLDIDALRRWLAGVRVTWWARYALHRFVADLADGAIVAFDSYGELVPPTFWESDTTLDVESSHLLGAIAGDRIPLRPGLRFCATGDAPVEVKQRREAVAKFGSLERAIAAAVDAHHDELVGRRRPDQARFLAERLPGFKIEAISGYLRGRGSDRVAGSRRRAAA